MVQEGIHALTLDTPTGSVEAGADACPAAPLAVGIALGFCLFPVSIAVFPFPEFRVFLKSSFCKPARAFLDELLVWPVLGCQAVHFRAAEQPFRRFLALALALFDYIFQSLKYRYFICLRVLWPRM